MELILVLFLQEPLPDCPLFLPSPNLIKKIISGACDMGVFLITHQISTSCQLICCRSHGPLQKKYPVLSVHTMGRLFSLPNSLTLFTDIYYLFFFLILLYYSLIYITCSQEWSTIPTTFFSSFFPFLILLYYSLIYITCSQEWSMIPACPSLICFCNRGDTEGTNSSRICVWCLCMFCFM